MKSWFGSRRMLGIASPALGALALSGLALAGLSLPTGCALPESSIGESYTTIQLTNTLSMVRDNEPIEIPLSEVRARFKKFDESDFSVHVLPANWYPERGDALLATDPAPTIPAQVIDKNFDGTPDTLLVICDFRAGEKRFLAVASPQFSRLSKATGPRVGGGLMVRETTRREGGALKSEGRYVAVNNAVLDQQHVKGDGLYQCDGPVFETDSNGWRLLFDSRMCLDVIGKRERELYLQPKNAAFTADAIDLSNQPWGGSLLGDIAGFGAGAFGYAEKGSVVPMSGFDSAQFRLMKGGPAALEAEVVLFGAKLGKESFDLRWRITQYAGSRMLRHDVNVSRTGHGLAFVMNADGLKKELPSGGQSWMRVSSYGPSNVGGGATGSLGLGVLANGRTATGFVKDPADVIGVAFDTITRNLTFYSVAAWDGEPMGLRSAQDFQKYLDELAQRLDTPIKIANLDKAIGN
ncbi:MAG: DUF4861 family protein [Planctomycetes bacterium]|nr:DUF4861 family protein [Planctomycetota bacterium]